MGFPLIMNGALFEQIVRGEAVSARQPGNTPAVAISATTAVRRNQIGLPLLKVDLVTLFYSSYCRESEEKW